MRVSIKHMLRELISTQSKFYKATNKFTKCKFIDSSVHEICNLKPNQIHLWQKDLMFAFRRWKKGWIKSPINWLNLIAVAWNSWVAFASGKKRGRSGMRASALSLKIVSHDSILSEGVCGPLKTVPCQVSLIGPTPSLSWSRASPIRHPTGPPRSPKATKNTTEITWFCWASLSLGKVGNSPLETVSCQDSLIS